MLEFGAFVTPSAEDADATVARVVEAEQLGLDLVGIQDHPYQRRFLDTWTLLAFAAARTQRVKLFPDVANLPLRPPAMLAKAAASLDVLSGGRVELGMGAGAFWEGIAAMDGPARSGPESVDALREAIAVVRAWWAGEGRVDGSHYRLAGARPGPPPAHRIGIWLGAYGPRMMRMTGELADGWIPSLPRLPLDDLPGKVALLEQGARRAGRDPASVRRVANVSGTLADGPVHEWLHGPPEHWIEALSELHHVHGFDGFVLWPAGDDPEQLARFAAEVAAPLREAGSSSALSTRVRQERL